MERKETGEGLAMAETWREGVRAVRRKEACFRGDDRKQASRGKLLVHQHSMSNILFFLKHEKQRCSGTVLS